jgi:phosphoglycolate phosphatase
VSACAVFDLDGTLIDSLPVCVEILNDMLAERGSDARVSSASVRRLISRGGPAMVSELLGVACGDPLAAIAEFRERYAGMPASASVLYPGVRAGLERLAAQGIRMAIHSNKPQFLCDKILAELGVGRFFDAVIGARPGEPAKPHPAGLRHALQMLAGLAAASCYVGDSEIDHETARRADMRFVLLTYGYACPDYDFVGAMRAHRFSDAVAIVGALSGVDRSAAEAACGRAA